MKTTANFALCGLLLLIPQLALAQDQAAGDTTAELKKELTVIAGAAIQYSKNSGQFPYFDEGEKKAFRKGLELLITKKYLKGSDLKTAQKSNSMFGFFMKMSKDQKSPRLICAVHSLKVKKMLVALTDGSIVAIDLSSRAKFKAEIEKYLTPRYLNKGAMRVNELRAIGALRSLYTSQIIHRERSKSQAYGTLQELLTAKLVDEALGSGEKAGYRFTVHVGDKKGQNKKFKFHILATPVKPGETGRRHFYVDETGAIRHETDKPANEKSENIYARKKANKGTKAGKTNVRGTSIPVNEANAIGTLRTISSAQVLYLERSKGNVYGTLEQLIKANFISASLKSGKKSGYVFKVMPGDRDGKHIQYLYTVTAEPIEAGKTGKRYFFIDQSGIIRYSNSGPADSRSKVLGS